MTTAEQKLACAVIAQAIRDAMPKTYPDRYATSNDRRQAKQDMDEARIFLTAESGTWMQSRNNWCSIAGYDGESLRAKMRHAIRLYDEKWNSKAVARVKRKLKPVTA